MSTKIFYNDNRIIIDGHADTEQECQAITAMCDSLANDENFKTIVYEKGHAVFERVDGGDAMMFAMVKYVTLDQYGQEVGTDYPWEKGTVANRLDELESIVTSLKSIPTSLELLTSRITLLENKTSKTLPYTADELITKLESI